MRDLFIAVGVVVVGFSLLLGSVAGINYVLESYRCRSKADIMGAANYYSLSTACMIKPEGKPWVPLRQYRVN